MSGGGSKKQSTTIQSNDPWKPLQAPLQQGIGDIQKLYGQGKFNIPYYSGSTVAPTSPAMQASWDAGAKYGLEGNAATNAGQKYITGLLGGDYSTLQPLISEAKDQVNSTYAAAGRYGSGAHDSAVTRGVGNVIANQVMNAAQVAPQYAQQQQSQIAALNQIGSQQQQQAQNLINADIERYNYNQSAPIQAVLNYMQALQGSYGGTTSTTSPTVQSGTGDYVMGGLGIGASLLGSALAGGYL